MPRGGLFCAFLPCLPGLPPIDLGHPDVFLTLSMGRNSLPDRQLGTLGSARVKGLSSALEWLGPRFATGKPNQQLAQQTNRALLLGAPYSTAIVQWEIYVALPPHIRERVESVWPKPGVKAYRTPAVLSDMQAIIEQRGYKNPALIVHSFHAWRAYHLARRIINPEIGLREQAVTCFDRHSVQWVTRNPLVWIPYESFCRVHHKVHGLL